jgi:hypothetical protein
MLPATLQFLITMIACAKSERMQRKLDYTQEEVRVLREILAAITGSGRISFTADQRRRLAVAGKALNPEERTKCCQVVKPGTLLGWFRQMVARKYDSSKRKVGRPRKDRDIRKLVIDMALANLGWGYTKYECLNQFAILSERHLRHLIKEFVEHCMTGRFHQGIGGQLIRNVGPTNDNGADGKVACRSRLGGLLSYYYREAA